MDKITQGGVRELYNYNVTTGELTWKNPTNSHTVKGSVVGSLHKSGYLITSVMGRYFSLHRLIWIFMYGYNPESDIDHIDGDKTNNRLSNLREVSTTCNVRNSKRKSSNKSGIKGVHFNSCKNKWIAEICVNYINKSLGSYNNIEDAVCARFAAEQCLDWGSCDVDSDSCKFIKGMNLWK